MNPESIIIVATRDTLSQDFPWGNLTWFASQPQGNQNNITVGRCTLLPGAENPRHLHPNCSEVLVVGEGLIEHTGADGRMHVMQPGDVVSIPPNVVHQARNIGPGRAVLWIAFSSAARETRGE